MDIGDEFRLRLRGELRKIPEDRLLDRAVDIEPPALAGNIWRQPEVEDGPIPGEMLSRRQTLFLGPRDFAGPKAAGARGSAWASDECGERAVEARGGLGSRRALIIDARDESAIGFALRCDSRERLLIGQITMIRRSSKSLAF